MLDEVRHILTHQSIIENRAANIEYPFTRNSYYLQETIHENLAAGL